MNITKYKSSILLLLIVNLSILSNVANAQKKTTKDSKDKKQLDISNKETTVTVTSEFVPTLKPSSKINFSGNTPLPSGEVPKLSYDIPSQNLFFPYVPGSLRPLALDRDSISPWRNDGYLKLGYGNRSTPYAEGGLAFGDGVNSSYGLHVRHTQSKGTLPLQKLAQTQADLNAVYTLNDINELTGKLYYDQHSVYAYGVRPEDSVRWNRDSSKIHYATYGLKVGLRNKLPIEGFTYAPTLSMNIFSDNWKAHESNFVLDAPVTYDFDENIKFNVGILADVTSYKYRDTGSVNNNIFIVSPSVTYQNEIFKAKAGLAPSWDQGSFRALPEIGAEAKISDDRFIILAGYKSYYEKNTFRSLVFQNYWIAQPNDLQNTRSNEFYFGFKGTAGDHFTYNATASTMKIYNKALFLNDTILGNRFNTVFEPSMNDFRIHAEFGYKQAEDFSLMAGFTYNHYSSLDSNAEAWGLLPAELNVALRWKLLPKLWLTSDLYLWNASYYLSTAKVAEKVKGAADWSIGAEYKITNNWSAWVRVNNLLNSDYQRWNQYKTMGINVLGGIAYRFDMRK